LKAPWAKPLPPARLNRQTPDRPPVECLFPPFAAPRIASLRDLA